MTSKYLTRLKKLEAVVEQDTPTWQVLIARPGETQEELDKRKMPGVVYTLTMHLGAGAQDEPESEIEDLRQKLRERGLSEPEIIKLEEGAG